MGIDKLVNKIVLAIALGLVINSADIASAQEIKWIESPQKAVDTAHTTGKKILVYVGSPHCHFCVKMDRNVWSDRSVANRISREFVTLKLSAKKDRDLIRSMKVKGYPATLVFSSDRKLLGRFDGYVSREELGAGLARLPKRASTPSSQTR